MKPKKAIIIWYEPDAPMGDWFAAYTKLPEKLDSVYIDHVSADSPIQAITTLLHHLGQQLVVADTEKE